jgi:SAM-dependent methyltransferase
MKKPAISILAGLIVTGLACAADSAPQPILLSQLTLELAPPVDEQPARKPDIHFVPTPDDVIAEMLAVAKVKKEDVLYDLGCGDGRIVIAAAKQFGTKGIGIDIDPARIREAKQAAEKAGVQTLTDFKVDDIFKTNFSDATVITLYLLNTINVKLRPKILAETRPGTRIASHAFTMGEWEPDEHRDVDSKSVYYWVVPANLSGTWKIVGGEEGAQTVSIQQNFQKFTGSLMTDGKGRPIGEGRITGDKFTFTTSDGENKPVTISGVVHGDEMEASDESGQNRWKGKRDPGTKGQVASTL